METVVKVKYPGIYENRWRTRYHFECETKRTSKRNKFVVPDLK